MKYNFVNYQAHYKMLAKFMDLGPICDVTATINGATAKFKATLDKDLCAFQVDFIEVTKIG